MDTKVEKVINRLKQQYEAYEKEMIEINEDTDGMIDISVACALANSVPYLIKQIEELNQEVKRLNAIEINSYKVMQLAHQGASRNTIIKRVKKGLEENS